MQAMRRHNVSLNAGSAPEWLLLRHIVVTELARPVKYLIVTCLFLLIICLSIYHFFRLCFFFRFYSSFYLFMCKLAYPGFFDAQASGKRSIIRVLGDMRCSPTVTTAMIALTFILLAIRAVP